MEMSESLKALGRIIFHISFFIFHLRISLFVFLRVASWIMLVLWTSKTTTIRLR
jgi:hypothetical protein